MSRKITVQVDLIMSDDETPEEMIEDLSDFLAEEYGDFIPSRGCEVREMWS